MDLTLFVHQKNIDGLVEVGLFDFGNKCMLDRIILSGRKTQEEILYDLKMYKSSLILTGVFDSEELELLPLTCA